MSVATDFPLSMPFLTKNTKLDYVSNSGIILTLKRAFRSALQMLERKSKRWRIIKSENIRFDSHSNKLSALNTES